MIPGYAKAPPNAGAVRGLDTEVHLKARPSRRPTIMVLVVTGGSKPATKNNREAVMRTWADSDTYMVTKDPVDWARVIELPAEAEEGGMNLLSRKVLHMWEAVARDWADKYDYFMKADDDVYVNLPRIRQDLAFLDPDAPAFLGSKRFGGSAKGTPGPGPLWQNKDYMKFAHGGAG